MLQKIRRARLLWPSLLTLAGLVVLAGLGSWQLQRRNWKFDLIGKIEARTNAVPVPLSRAIALWREKGDVEYLRVAATGRFLHEDEKYVFAPGPRGLGYHVYTPLETRDGHLLLVNRGFVSAELKSPQPRSAGQIAGETKVVGLARQPHASGWFTPESDPQRGLFYWPDYDGMLAGSERRARELEPVPFFVDAEALPANPGGWPKGGVTNLALPNRHLEYALTWFGLAATLACVYAGFARARLKAAG